MAKQKGKYSRVKNLNLKLYNISKKTGIGNLYIVYSHMGKEKYFPTTIPLQKDKWDSELKQPKHRALSVDDTNAVDALYDKIAKYIREYQNENDMVMPPIQHIDERITKRELPTDIHELFQEYIKANESRLAEGTITAYKIAGDLLKEVDKYYKYKLSLHNFNYGFILKFVEYCQHVKESKNSNTTVSYRISIFKGFVNYLTNIEVKHSIKTSNWDVIDSVTTATPDILCLEREELDEILAYQPTGKREHKIKDIIVWLSHTAMRISDVKNITKNHIVDDVSLEYIPSKTKKRKKGGVVAKVPISKPVRDILERYDYKPPYMDKSNVQKSIRLFCSKFPSLQKEIRYIETDGAEEKETFVPKYSVLTSHAVGRKTFINLCIEKGIPIPTVMSMSAHLTLDTVINSYVQKHRNSLPQLQQVFEF